MKVFKIFGIIILITLALIGVLLIASAINHKNQLRKEATEYLPPGSSFPSFYVRFRGHILGSKIS